MRQLTIRGFDEQLRETIEMLARDRGISLNKAALLLLRRGAGLETEQRATNTVGDALDEFIGSWSREDESELLATLDGLEAIDGQLWR